MKTFPPRFSRFILLTISTMLSTAAWEAKAQQVDLYDILANSPYKSPNITWSASGESSVQAGDTTLKYDWAQNDQSHGIYHTRFLPSSSIGSVVADFEKVSANGDGGAIFIGNLGSYYSPNYTGINLAKINGDFISNRAYSSLPDYYSGSHGSYGGAIYYDPEYVSSSGSYRTALTEITGDFIGNSAESHNGFVSGGAIYLYGAQPNLRINANFIGNHTETDYSSAHGGALSGQGSVKELIGNFISNYVKSPWSAEGGAIYAGFRNGNGLEALSADFIDNYALATGGDSGDARGGAIYVDYSESGYESKITFVADGAENLTTVNKYQQDVLFKGNYVQDGEDGEKKYEAIYNNGTLVFDSRNGGSFTFYDYINSSASGSKINFVSDGNGVFNLYNDIRGRSALQIENPYTFNMINQEINKIAGSSLNVSEAVKLNIDVRLSDGVSDSFAVANIDGAENFTLDKINLLEDMLDDVEGLRIKYANAALTGNVFTREQATSNATYTISNDGQYLLVANTGKPGGYASFLADINNQGEERTYSFTKDEEIGHILSSGSDKTGTVEGKEANLTIFGNGKTLSSGSDTPYAMSLTEEQSAEINDLTISGFANGLLNAGKMTLNNVTLADNQIALQNTGDILFKGENTISGGDYALIVESMRNEYPLFATYFDYEMLSIMKEIGSYGEMVERWPEIAAEMGMDERIAQMGIKTDDVDWLNFADYPKILARFLAKDMGLETADNATEFDVVSAVLAGRGINISQEDYEHFLGAMETVGKEQGPGAALNLLMGAVGGRIYYSYEDFVEAYVQYNLEDDFSADEIAEMTDEELAEYKADILRNLEEESADINEYYERYNAPNPAEKMALNKTETVLDFAEDAVLNLNAKISGNEVYGLTLSGADNAKINLNSTIEKADLVLDGPVLKLFDESANLADLNSMEVKSGTLDLQNGKAGVLVVPNLMVSGNLDLYLDADLAEKKMDQIKLSQYSEEYASTGVISIADIKLLSDAKDATTKIALFADETSKEALKDVVTGSVSGISYSPIYKYDAEYSTADGTVTFIRSAQENEESDAEPEDKPDNYNPALYAGTVSSNVVGFVQTVIDNAAFAHILPQNTVSGMASGDMPKANNAWVSVVGFNDDVELKHFNTVDSELVSVIGGVNSDKYNLGRGWATYGVYAGYLNGKQKYAANKIEQNGGYIGLSAGYELNNFVVAATINTGFVKNEDKNIFGNDKFDTYWGGAGVKGGYNYSLGYGLTLQPNLQVGYTYVNTEAYTSKSGVKVKNDALHLWETAPGLMVSKQFKNAWRGYAQTKYAFVMKSGGSIEANEIALPHISSKNYVEYGLGIEKDLSDRWSFSAEVNRRDGGREGWNGNVTVKYNF